MPQLDPATFVPQLFWLAVIFTLFYLVLSRLALPRIEKVLKDRTAKIGGDRQAARDAQHNADKEAKLYEAEIATAKGKAHVMIRASREKLDGELNEKRRDHDSQLAAKSAETETRVRAMLEKAAGEMEAITADVVGDIVKELGGVEVSDSEVRTALRQSLKE